MATQGRRIPPPVDLHELAGWLGVSSVSEVDMVEDGRTVWDEDGPRVELRPDRPHSRRRFTLAHELAHVVLDRESGRRALRRRTLSLSPRLEETLCDWVAASLLMPAWWMAPRLHRPTTLRLLREISAAADVSLAAAATRTSHLAPGDCVLLRWRRGPSQWVLAGRAGAPSALTGRVVPTPATAEAMAGAGRADSRQRVQLQTPHLVVGAQAELSRYGETCLMLLTALDLAAE